MADLKTNLLGFAMNSPIIGASGTVGYGVEYEELADFTKIGGISGKGLTLHGQYGNKGERLWETPSGLINSIGLQNPGVQHFIDVELNEMLELKQKYGTVAIANLGGHSEEEYVEGAALLSDSAVDIVELNISCPNVKVGGMAYGVKAEAAGAKTMKLKYGHRGANQPVTDFESGRTFITSQNHGYAVVGEELPAEMGEVAQVNANDGTCEGIKYKKWNCFTVQFHPEANGGPKDTEFLFDRFLKNVKAAKEAR